MSRPPTLTPEERHARKLARTNRWRAANQDHLRAYREANKERDRALVVAWEQANPDKVLAKAARYRAKNRTMLNEKHTGYRATHAEEIKAKRTTPVSRAKAAKHHRDKRAENPAPRRAYERAYYAANQETELARQLAWSKVHPEQNIARQARRRARLVNDPGNDATAAHYQTVIDAAHGVCCYCPHYNPDCQACRKGSHKLTVDHIIALANGGSNTLHNLVACCKSCNSKKRTHPNPVPVQPLLL